MHGPQVQGTLMTVFLSFFHFLIIVPSHQAVGLLSCRPSQPCAGLQLFLRQLAEVALKVEQGSPTLKISCPTGFRCILALIQLNQTTELCLQNAINFGKVKQVIYLIEVCWSRVLFKICRTVDFKDEGWRHLVQRLESD